MKQGFYQIEYKIYFCRVQTSNNVINLLVEIIKKGYLIQKKILAFDLHNCKFVRLVIYTTVYFHVLWFSQLECLCRVIIRNVYFCVSCYTQMYISASCLFHRCRFLHLFIYTNVDSYDLWFHNCRCVRLASFGIDNCRFLNLVFFKTVEDFHICRCASCDFHICRLFCILWYSQMKICASCYFYICIFWDYKSWETYCNYSLFIYLNI